VGAGRVGAAEVRVAVIGAGLAGLAAACELADLGHRPIVFERRPFAGGKTYSFRDGATEASVDNGQHVFMTCTTEYIAFLRRIGSLGQTRRQERLRVRVYDGEGRRADIRASALPAPFHLAASFARYRHLAVKERLAVARTMATMARMKPGKRQALHHRSFADWLGERGQSARVVGDFWDFMLLPTLNCRSAEASAADALFVLQEGFLKSSRSAAIGVSKVGLSELHVEPAIRYIEERGGEVWTSAAVESLDRRRDRVESLWLTNGTRQEFDGYICATPHTQVRRLLPPDVAAMPEFAALDGIETSPIINLHLWFDRPVARFAFAGFVGSELQWIFNRSSIEGQPADERQHLVVSLSAATPYMALGKKALEDRFLPQLRRALPAARDARLVRFLAIKEPEATFLPAPGLSRPGAITPLANFYLAGAYTATGWPATMESAVRSGIKAARALHGRCDSFAAPRPGVVGAEV
jgi:squalene-associated FAD-dependent desaturase